MATPEETDAKRLDAPPMLGLPDDLLVAIFLCLPTLEDVGRAATACPTFRRVVADRSFRRRLRSVQPAPFLGVLHGKFYPAKAPHPSAPYARALARAADFSFEFIRPSRGPWILRDVRDGRVLLENSSIARMLAVADPVFRRHVLLPPIPGDLGAPVLQQRRLHLEPILVPAAEEEEEETSFKVICVAVCRAHLVAFLFSSAEGGWSAFPFQDWIASTANVSTNTLWFRLHWRYCVNGCFYWRVTWAKKLLVLDTCSMEFTFADIPHVHTPSVQIRKHRSAIAETGDSRAELFTLRRDVGCQFDSLYSMKRSANGWQSQKKVQVQFPPRHDFLISGATRRYLLLKEMGESMLEYNWPSLRSRHTQYFLLDIEKMRLEKACELDCKLEHLNLYTGFPPSLSLPSL